MDIPDLEERVTTFIAAAAAHAEQQLDAARAALDGAASAAARDFAAEAREAKAGAQAAVSAAEEAVANAEHEWQWWADGGDGAREAARGHVTEAHERANAAPPSGDVHAHAGAAAASADAPQPGGQA